jgi:hypothetical protein
MKTKPTYQQCSLSVMDTISDPDIRFDEKGISQYYYDYRKGEELNVKRGEQGKKNWSNWWKRSKKTAKANRTTVSWD